jgi:nitrite reductase/ring-hydroxylating ferredoxin subunit
MSEQRIASLAELSGGNAIVFTYKQDGIRREGFALLANGKIVCYENLCRHLPVKLDSGSRHFLTKSGCHILCQSHGALYQLETGFCERGPCAGASLIALPYCVKQEIVYLLIEDQI